jgi:hypothetical protein
MSKTICILEPPQFKQILCGKAQPFENATLRVDDVITIDPTDTLPSNPLEFTDIVVFKNYNKPIHGNFNRVFIDENQSIDIQPDTLFVSLTVRNSNTQAFAAEVTNSLIIQECPNFKKIEGHFAQINIEFLKLKKLSEFNYHCRNAKLIKCPSIKHIPNTTKITGDFVIKELENLESIDCQVETLILKECPNLKIIGQSFKAKNILCYDTKNLKLLLQRWENIGTQGLQNILQTLPPTEVTKVLNLSEIEKLARMFPNLKELAKAVEIKHSLKLYTRNIKDSLDSLPAVENPAPKG